MKSNIYIIDHGFKFSNDVEEAWAQLSGWNCDLIVPHQGVACPPPPPKSPSPRQEKRFPNYELTDSIQKGSEEGFVVVEYLNDNDWLHKTEKKRKEKRRPLGNYEKWMLCAFHIPKKFKVAFHSKYPTVDNKDACEMVQLLVRKTNELYQLHSDFSLSFFFH